ncbi:MAG: hypothetical protein ACRDD1_13095, partial [Planctomycetia bacterium]
STPPPQNANGFVTFGSHHQLYKLNPPLLDCWRRILESVPGARLRLFRSGFTGQQADAVRRRLAEARLPIDRVDVSAPPQGQHQHLRGYADVDVLLDAHPFNGHTTTCEALWMGVPVATWRGSTPAARLAASVLTALDLKEYIGDGPDAYVAAAVRAADDRAGRATLRRELRDRMTRTLCDGAGFTRRLEQTYRALWEERASHPDRRLSRPTPPTVADLPPVATSNGAPARHSAEEFDFPMPPKPAGEVVVVSPVAPSPTAPVKAGPIVVDGGFQFPKLPDALFASARSGSTAVAEAPPIPAKPLVATGGLEGNMGPMDAAPSASDPPPSMFSAGPADGVASIADAGASAPSVFSKVRSNSEGGDEAPLRLSKSWLWTRQVEQYRAAGPRAWTEGVGSEGA